MARYLTINRTDGEHYEEEAIEESAGAADAGKIPALDENGVLDPSIINAALSGANKIVQLNGAGRLDPSVIPVGFGPDAVNIIASESLSATDVVNIYFTAGAFRVRKADAATNKPANGFVNDNYDADEEALVFREGTNTGLSGLTSPKVYLSATTPGGVTNTPPSAAGQILQRIGTASAVDSFYFSWSAPTHLV